MTMVEFAAFRALREYDYALPPGYYPASVADNRAGMYIDQSALPGPFTLPGRDNPWPWNWCVGC